MATDSPECAAAYEKFRRGSYEALTAEERNQLLGTVDFYDRVHFENGDKRALLGVIAQCARKELPLPAWAATAFCEAYFRSRDGKLKSWNEVFGKPWPGKSRKGTATESRAVAVWIEVNRLHHDEGCPIDEGLFERVGKSLGVGRRSTISRLYWRTDRIMRGPMHISDGFWPRLRSHRPKIRS
jgi:hypothetical protein